MEDIIDLLLVIALQSYRGQTKHFGKSKNTLNSQGHVKQGEKNMLHKAKPARTSERLRGNQKKIASLYQIAPHERHFCPFALEKLNIRNVIPTS